jgi:hypothetical protein
MSTSRSITDLQILGSSFLRGSRQARRRDPETGGRPLKNRSRALPRLELLEERMMLTIFNVNSNADTNTGTNATTGTLRFVLNQLDLFGGSSNTISFASLPAADFTFTPGSALPAITKQVTIEANTAPGFSGAPLIQLSGGSAGSVVSGLVLANGSSGSVIESLVINEFSLEGIEIDSSNDSVTGSYIGTDVTGGTAEANGDAGILVDFSGATIGGTSAGAANIISGNGFSGVEVNTSCLVEGNRIGTNQAGTAPVPNADFGIDVEDSGATIGGTSAGAANIISGNGTGGVYDDAQSLVEGNLIGTNAAGTAPVPNGTGIYVTVSNSSIGGTSAGAANIISGNSAVGVDVQASYCLVEGNLIGTNAAGTDAVGNAEGILVEAPRDTIGGTSAGAANIISGNSGVGVDIKASNCLVEGNVIGTNQAGSAVVGNTSDGIYVEASGASIGGTSAGGGNTIAFNGGPGVATGLGVTGTTIRYNAIFSNVGPGIDRNDDGVTLNTPNGAYNTPVLTSVAGGIISGTLNAAPNGTYIIDFYANLASDASPTRPQGRDYLTSTPVMTNAAGDAVFSVYYTPFPGLPIFTATSTDADGTTSEFSPLVGYALAASGATFAATTGVSFQGTVASFTSSAPAATAAEFTATINFGDSTKSAAGTVVAAPGGFIVVGSHTYTTANLARPVTVTITETVGGGQATANSLANVTSLLTPVSWSPVFVAGTLASRVVASFTDNSLQAFPGELSATINWGDNTGTTPGVVSADGKGFDVTGSHTYNFRMTSTVSKPVTVIITDTLTGASVTANSTATVAPAPITIQMKNFAVKGGVRFSGTLAAFTDSDPRINPHFYTAAINWGDGSPKSTGVITGTNPFTVTSSHTFAPFQNIDLVTVTITDKNGRTVTGVDRVVDPPAVLDIQRSGLTLSPNKPFVGTVATFSDTGSAEPASDYRATINWGKGRKAAGMITGSNGQFVVSGTEMFSRLSGAKTVSVTVTDITDGRTVSVNDPVSYIVRHPRVGEAKRPVKIAVKS